MNFRVNCLGILMFASFAAGQLSYAETTHKHHSHMEGTISSPDSKFLDMMSAHHKDGIKMSELASKKAETKEVKAVADKIIKDQKKELEQMQAWRNRKFGKTPKSTEMPPKMDMSKLEQETGKNFDKEFTAMMAKHHEDGIKMANEMASKLEDSEVKTFAKKMSKNQMKEKDHLKHLQSTL